jgi:hypothetical protein
MTPRRRPAGWLAVMAWAAGCGGPEPAFEVVSAEERGLVAQAATIQGRDGGSSALLWGRSVWTFGDTVLNVPDEDGAQWHHNSFSITEDLVAADGIAGFVEPPDGAGAPRYFLAPTAEEQAFNDAHDGDPCMVEPCGARWAVWPGAPVYDAARDRGIIFYGLIYAEPGSFNFHGVGTGVALWGAPDAEPERPVVSPGAEHPTLLFHEGEPDWGQAALVEGDVVYAFACVEKTFSRPCLLARVPAADVLVRDAWRFWDGADWVTDWRDAAELFDGAPILSVSWNAYLGAYLAVYAPSLENRVKARTAPALTGPWSDEATLFRTPRMGEGWTYDAVEHAEYAEDGGRVIWISYSRPNGVGWFGSELALWRVELARKVP